MKTFPFLRAMLVLMVVLLAPLSAFAQALPSSAVTRGTCRFRCVSATDPDGERLVPERILNCLAAPTEQTCQAECDRICPIAGPEGNNIMPIARGTGLRCARDPSPVCFIPPATPAATGGAASGATGSQTANSASTLPNPLGETDLVKIFGRISQAIMGILGALALLWFIWGGVLWMTAGESKRTEEAKGIIKNAALGIVLLFFSYGLATAFLAIFEEVGNRSTSRASTPSIR
jgi:hypothetical protein